MTASPSIRADSAHILRDAPADQLALAVALNQGEWIAFQGQLPDTQLHLDRDVAWICSRVPGRPNTVTCAQLDSKRPDQRIEKIIRRYSELSAPISWWIGPGSAPPDLPRRLRQSGFHCMKHFPAMVLDLSRMRRRFAAPKGLRIEPLRDFAIFQKYAHPLIGPITTDRRRARLDGEERLAAVRPQRLFPFVASIDGEPLGHAMIFLGAGVAGVYDVGTIQRARGKGIGTAVTIAAATHARKLGYHYAVLKASGEGESVYQRIGFTEVCRMSLWYYSRRHHGAEE